MRAIFFIAAFQFAIPVFTQGQSLDSLRQSIEATVDSNKFEVTMDAMRLLLDRDNEAALELSLLAISYASKDNDSLSIAKGLYAQSYILGQLERYDESIVVARRIIGIAKRNGFDSEYGRALNNIATSYTLLGKYDKALEHYFQSLILNERLNRIESASITLNNIGLVYYKLSNNEEAIKYYKKSLEYKKKTNSSYDLDRLYINMALCYTNSGELSLVEDLIKQALDICKGSCSDIILVEAKFGLGVVYKAQGKLELSELNFKEALRLARALNEKRFEIESLKNISIIFSDKAVYDSALLYLSAATDIAIKYKYSQILLDIYKQYSEVYGKLNDYKNEALYAKKYSNLKDSAFSVELIRNLATIQADYSERENLSTIADNERVIRAQRYLNFAIAFIGLMAFAFIYLIMRNTQTDTGGRKENKGTRAR
mgnify:CR=1 FL=1